MTMSGLEQNAKEVAENHGHRKELEGQDREALGLHIGEEVWVLMKNNIMVHSVITFRINIKVCRRAPRFSSLTGIVLVRPPADFRPFSTNFRPL